VTFLSFGSIGTASALGSTVMPASTGIISADIGAAGAFASAFFAGITSVICLQQL